MDQHPNTSISSPVVPGYAPTTGRVPVEPDEPDSAEKVALDTTVRLDSADADRMVAVERAGAAFDGADVIGARAVRLGEPPTPTFQELRAKFGFDPARHHRAEHDDLRKEWERNVHGLRKLAIPSPEDEVIRAELAKARLAPYDSRQFHGSVLEPVVDEAPAVGETETHGQGQQAEAGPAAADSGKSRKG